MAVLNGGRPPMVADSIVCFNCGQTLQIDALQKIFRSDECQKCYAKIHVCKMCRFYDPSYYNDCREDQAERIVDKERVNYCEYFVLLGESFDKQQRDQQEKAAKALFRN